MTSANASPGERRPRLHVVALAHLDTQWRWTVRDTAARFLPDTVEANERLFARFPGYVLNFEGAHRYRLLAECHPDHLEIVRKRVADGRWFAAGAAWEAFDANLPSPESLVRQILLGRLELERTLGRASDEIFLPDCFGFPVSLPTVAAHCGIVGFLTQKLRRGPEMRAAHGIPFPLGRWRGPDGSEVVAALDPGEYGAQTREDLSRSGEWRTKLAAQAEAGLPDLLPTLQGLGDKGGAIAPETAEWLERSSGSDGPLEVRVVPAERIYHDLSPAERAALPVHSGDLLLRLHATGCYSSRAQLKRRHRDAEWLAQTAERAAALAAPLRVAPDRAAARDALRSAWERVLSHQMHDDLTGTSLPEAYRHSADGLAAALNGFAGELESAIDAIARTLDTDVAGEPIAVFNPLSCRRHEQVEVRNLEGFASPPQVLDGEGRSLVAEWRRGPRGWNGRFLAEVAGLSLSIFELRESAGAAAEAPAIGGERLENDRFALGVNEGGDLVSWIDRRDGRELLRSPAGVDLLASRSERFPSWEIRYEDVARAPRSRLGESPARRSSESGPLRRFVRVDQVHEGSRWRRDYVVRSGSRDAESIVEIDCRVDWRSDATLAKAAFDFAWSFPEALYDLGVGFAPRPVSTPELYEVPAQGFAAAPFAAGSPGGVAVLSDCKQGWDHPDGSRLRLTLFHTPRIGRRFRYQARQDFGAHRFRIGLARYDSLAELARLGECFRAPLLAFRAPRRGAGSTRSWSPLRIADGSATAMALKPAERGDALVLRLRETSGSAARVEIEWDRALRPRGRLDGAERPLAADAGPEIRLQPLGLLALEVGVSSGDTSAESDRALDFDRDRSLAGDRGEIASDRGIDDRGARIPRPILPARLRSDGVELDLTPHHRRGEPGAAEARGQEIVLPGGFARLALLVGAFGGAVDDEIAVGNTAMPIAVPDSLEALGRFDELARTLPLVGRPRVRSGWLRRAPLALRVEHRLDRRGAIDPCRPVNLFRLDFALPPGARSFRLPAAPRLLLLAATVSTSPPPASTPLAPLFAGEWEDR